MKAISICHVLIILSIQIRSFAHKSYRRQPANVVGTSYIVKLTETTFKEEVFRQDQAVILEFYSSISEDTQFAPVFNNFCIDIKYWWEVIHCKAVDCGLPEFLQICDTYNEEGVLPNLKYIPPNYDETAGTGNSVCPGRKIEDADLPLLRWFYVYQLQIELYSSRFWPMLKVLNKSEILDTVIKWTPIDPIRYVVVISDKFLNNSIVPFEVILDLSSLHCVKVFAARSGAQIIEIYDKKNQRIAFFPTKQLDRWGMFCQVKRFMSTRGIEMKDPENHLTNRKF